MGTRYRWLSSDVGGVAGTEYRPRKVPSTLVCMPALRMVYALGTYIVHHREYMCSISTMYSVALYISMRCTLYQVQVRSQRSHDDIPIRSRESGVRSQESGVRLAFAVDTRSGTFSPCFFKIFVYMYL